MVVVAQLRVAEVNKDVKSDMESELGNEEPFSTIIKRTVYALENSFFLKKEKVEKYIGASTGGCLFYVIISGQNYVATVIVDFDAEYKKYRHEKAFENLKSKGISYVNFREKYDEYKGRDPIISFYSCVLVSQKVKYDFLTGEFFRKVEAKDMEDNSKKLFRFFGKVI